MSNIKIIGKKAKYFMKKYSPELLLGTSIACHLGAIVLSSKAGAKLVDVSRTHNEIIASIHADIDNGKYTAEEGKKLLKKEYVAYFKKVGLAYVPTAICFTGGTVCSIGAHNILTARVNDLTTLAGATAAAFASYRERVNAILGEDGEKKLADGIEKKIIKDPETGEEKEVEVKTANCPTEMTFYLNEKNYRSWMDNVGAMNTHLLLKKQELDIAFRTDGFMTAADQLRGMGITNDMMTEEQIRLSHVLGNLYRKSGDCLDIGLCDARGNLTALAYENFRRKEPYFVITFRFDGDIVNGVNGDKNETIAKYINSPLAV